ncbi:Ferric/cupric reductase transmembrane component 2 [Rhynchospora pubera]|uniref:Ferric/cupric reductase transmembrane component 2 n=1 Tax=Rhynchospora pubera TaxID=906938 RepID=A0AAV8GRS0_9POAL|nr:Ferric/cupric reductase transmembrane component 2 [Rhynchospora pubera]
MQIQEQKRSSGKGKCHFPRFSLSSKPKRSNRPDTMVCIACLLPLFLIPVVNALPLLFDFILSKVYRLFGWEYRKPERVPPACPFKPKSGAQAQDASEAKTTVPPHATIGEGEKED